MSILTDRLRAAGADMDGAMRRMVDDEELYGVCFAYFMDDPAFLALGEALKQEDFSAAFDAAHSIKGVAGNLGLMQMYEITSSMVEILRAKKGDIDRLAERYQELLEQRDTLKKLK